MQPTNAKGQRRDVSADDDTLMFISNWCCGQRPELAASASDSVAHRGHSLHCLLQRLGFRSKRIQIANICH